MNQTNFENHYKTRNFNGRLTRINNFKESRTDRRSVLRNSQRNIGVEITEKKTDIVEDRRIKLLKWKAEKEQIKQLKKQKQKPVFKVCRLDNKFENMTTNIQKNNTYANVECKVDTGLQRITRNKNKQKPKENDSLVPVGYLFKPPENILPLIDKQKNVNKRITRSQKLHVTPPAPLPTRSRIKKKKNEQINYDFPIKNVKMRNESLFESIVEEAPKKIPLNEILDISLTGSNQCFSTSKYGETSNFGIKTRKSVNKTPNQRISTEPSQNEEENSKKTISRRVSKSNNLQNDKLSDINVSVKTPGRRVSKINVEAVSVSKSTKKTPSRRSILPNIETTTGEKETPNRRVSSLSKNKEFSISTSNNRRKSAPNTSSNSMSSPLSDEVFLSPFVTTARGKQNARKEYKTKISLGIVTSPRDDDCLVDEIFAMSPPNNNYIQAKVFEDNLNSTIVRLQIECNKWEAIVASDFNASKEIKDEIDSTIGQARLLIAKKFEQFRGLIRNCMNKEGELPVTPKDLEGFWDMVYIQVENIDERFKKLLKIKENNWQEIKEPSTICAAVKRKVFAKSGRKKAVGPSTGIKALIEAARKKCHLSTSSAPEVLMQKSFGLIESTLEDNPQPTDVIRTPKHSLLTNVISSEKNKYTPRVSSPGLAIMKATSIAKCLEKGEPFTNTPVSYINMNATPGRSILKTPKTEKRKSQRRTKAVLFSDFESPAGKENEVPVVDLIDLSTPKTEERRRSKRLSQKLFI